MSTQTSTLRATWSPILGGLNEEELSCVANIAIERLQNDFGKPYSLTLDNNPSGTVQPPAAVVANALAAATTAPARARFPGKRWMRVVDKIDLAGKGGYAIVGDYTHATRIGRVPDGKLVVVSERQNGKLRVAVVQRANGSSAQCDVFDDGSFMLNDVVRVASADGPMNSKINLARAGLGWKPSMASATPAQFHGTPWATIIAVLTNLNVPTT